MNKLSAAPMFFLSSPRLVVFFSLLRARYTLTGLFPFGNRLPFCPVFAKETREESIPRWEENSK